MVVTFIIYFFFILRASFLKHNQPLMDILARSGFVVLVMSESAGVVFPPSPVQMTINLSMKRGNSTHLRRRPGGEDISSLRLSAQRANPERQRSSRASIRLAGALSYLCFCFNPHKLYLCLFLEYRCLYSYWDFLDVEILNECAVRFVCVFFYVCVLMVCEYVFLCDCVYVWL